MPSERGTLEPYGGDGEGGPSSAAGASDHSLSTLAVPARVDSFHSATGTLGTREEDSVIPACCASGTVG